MILPSRRQRRWLAAGIVLWLGATGAYVAYRWRAPFVHGGSAAGLAFGVAATLLILVLLAFGLRKRAYRSTWGTLDGWLQAHLYLGVLTVFVVLYHAGFRFHDRLAVATFLVLLLVVASGLLGARLYAVLPRRLTEVESNLTPEEISQQLNQLARSMARLASGRSARFQGVYRRLLEDAVPRRGAGWRLVLVGTGKRRSAGGGGDDWATSLALVEVEEREPLRQLLVLSRQHQELHLRLRFQQRYKNLLESWLFFHLPLSIVLLVLLAAHVTAVVYYGAL